MFNINVVIYLFLSGGIINLRFLYLYKNKNNNIIVVCVYVNVIIIIIAIMRISIIPLYQNDNNLAKIYRHK